MITMIYMETILLLTRDGRPVQAFAIDTDVTKIHEVAFEDSTYRGEDYGEFKGGKMTSHMYPMMGHDGYKAEYQISTVQFSK